MDHSLIWVGVAATSVGACISAGLNYLLQKAKERCEDKRLVKELAIRLTEYATRNGVDPLVPIGKHKAYADIYTVIENALQS